MNNTIQCCIKLRFLSSWSPMTTDSACGRRPGILEEMTEREVRDFAPEVLVLPLGSTEPHGPHLPYGTDTIIADRVTGDAVVEANRKGARVLRIPPLVLGNNVNFKGLPFACRIGVETLMKILVETVLFAREEGVRKVVLVNSHGGNDAAVKAALREIMDRFQQEVFACACTPSAFAGELGGQLFGDRSPHAGEYETSMVMHLAPELVVDSRRSPAEMREPEIASLRGGKVDWVRPWHELMPSSCGGRPDLASAEKGAAFHAACVAGLSGFLLELSRAAWHPSFPYAETSSAA